MKLGETLYVKNRDEWRRWLSKNFDKKNEIWLIYYRKASGKVRIPYDDAVEEALCFGWIDSTIKGVDDEKYAQRFSVRNPKSQWSQLNKERVRKLMKLGKMEPAGLAAFDGDLGEELTVPKDIEKALKVEKDAWENFQKFPESYKRIRIAFIEVGRRRPDEFKRRLNYFVRMTAQNKKFGTLTYS